VEPVRPRGVAASFFVRIEALQPLVGLGHFVHKVMKAVARRPVI
jgi:hypothetical protein